MIDVTRRRVLVLGGSAIAASWSSSALAQSGADAAAESHGMSAFGDLKYPADFKNFDYVNAAAPKGGTFSTIPSARIYNQSFTTFNSLNSFVLRGDGAAGMEQTFASLMVRAGDEPDAMYGLVARSVKISSDKLTYRFALRPEAKFHDGSKLAAHDVAFSMNILKEKGHPIIRQQLRDMVRAEVADDAVVVTFAPKRGRDVPLYVAGLPIFSKTYYAKQNFDESTLEIPLGSGPYKVGRFEPGRYIEYDRVKDWWAKDFPVVCGANNFDVVRYEFYRDRDVAFEGFTGRNYLYREEFTARIWNTRYEFPGVKDGRVKRETLPDETPSGAQGWFMNMRRAQFKDARVREALGLAFDFEWTNKTIMYDAYARTFSPFQNSDLMADNAPPPPEELKLLEPFRGQVPDEVFGVPYLPAVSDGSGQDRALLRKAGQMLNDAGFIIKDGKRRLPNGDVFNIEFLHYEPSLQPHHAPYIKNLATLGIDASFRLVDPVQYRARRDDFDFDITMERFSMASTPGNALRTFFSSQSAAIKGSQNLAGVAEPALDALIEKIIAADDRVALRIASRAFDRVFRAGRYWIPQWYSASHRIAYWDVFAHPSRMPKYAGGVGAPDLWWFDEAKAKKPEQAK